MPFSESDRYNYDLVNSYQHECIKEKVFGMGWGLDCQNIEFGEILNDISLEKYTETAKLQYNREELESSHLNAINLYYSFEKAMLKPSDLNLEGYEICKSLKKAKNKSCKITDDFVCFINNDVLFYSAEFEALILSGHFLEV